MNVSFFPIQLVVHNLIHVRIGESDIVDVRINEVTKIESVVDVHEQSSLPISMGERHLCVQIPDLVGRTGRLVLYDGRIDQIAITHKRHVPQSPETEVKHDSANCAPGEKETKKKK